MRCSAVLASGAQCAREAERGADLCSFHRSHELRRQARAFYLGLLSPEDQEALAVAANLEGVDGEIAMLRVVIRKVAGAGDITAFRRGLDTLCRMLRTRHELDKRATDRLSTELERVLDALESGEIDLDSLDRGDVKLDGLQYGDLAPESLESGDGLDSRAPGGLEPPR